MTPDTIADAMGKGSILRREGEALTLMRFEWGSEGRKFKGSQELPGVTFAQVHAALHANIAAVQRDTSYHDGGSKLGYTSLGLPDLANGDAYYSLLM
jgi:hypothetical protein